jgi:hypothetical protein
MAVAVVAGAVGMGLWALQRGGQIRPVRSGPPPNILIIITDDQRNDGTLDVMPKTRR